MCLCFEITGISHNFIYEHSFFQCCILIPLYSQWSRPKTHAWWLLLSHPARDEVLALKRIGAIPGGNRRLCSHTLVFDAPESGGVHELVLRVISDAAIGLDRELSISVSVSTEF